MEKRVREREREREREMVKNIGKETILKNIIIACFRKNNKLPQTLMHYQTCQL